MVRLVYPDKAMVEIYHKDADIKILFAKDTIHGGDVLPKFELQAGTIFVLIVEKYAVFSDVPVTLSLLKA